MGLYVLIEGGFPAPLTALALLSLWTAFTGGLHLDGFMDIADAVGSNAPLEKQWTIMKDPHAGAFGMIALVFLLAWKWGSLYVIIQQSSMYTVCFILIIIPLWVRGIVLVILYAGPAPRADGLASFWRKHLTGGDVGVALGFCGLIIAAVLLLEPGLWLNWLALLLIVSLAAWVYTLWLKHHFKAVNGDMLGAGIESLECLALIASLLLLRGV